MEITADTIRDAILVARTTPRLLKRARSLHGIIAGDVLSRNHDREPGTIRASDAGSCTRWLWANLNGKLDIPDDPKAELRKDNGSLFGAWLACLLKAYLEAQDPQTDVFLEAETADVGNPGHIDAAIIDHGIAAATVELKWSAWPGKTDGQAKPQHRIQSGKYAQAFGAPVHFVVTYFASAWAKGDWLTVHAFTTEETAFDVEVEYDRLKGALAVDMPEPDPPEEYLCKSCAFSKCELNVNPLRVMVEL